ncbi:hypothetical protein A7A76_13055 [Lysobacter enzymogenes]|uniref:hypothetical protein n=1 Tax=Lysobacter enzymogenes TaxID=69 RepID=UPI0019CF856B|nr:hypothetical protein [Lysobacter enzymogenes]MBN7135665.1 hypothetical protein [Lysobacter enzymogenes]
MPTWLTRPHRAPPLARWGGAAFMAFVVGGVAGMLCVEGELNGGLAQAVSWLWLPWLLMVAAFVGRYWRWLCERQRRAWRVLGGAVAVYLMGLLMGWPYLAVVNAIGDRGPLRLAGPVLSKRVVSSRRSDAHVLSFRDGGSGREIEMVVSSALFGEVAVGDRLACDLRQGWLGFNYRWRFGDSAPACSLATRRG